MARPLRLHVAAAALLILAPGVDRFVGAQEPLSRERVHRLLSEGRFQEARELAREQLERRGPSESSSWRWLISRSYEEEGDLEQAEQSWAALVDAGSGRVRFDARIQLARVRLQMFAASSAAEAVMKGAGSWPGDLEGSRQEILALASLQAGKKAQARAQLESLQEKSVESWYQLGVLAFDQGRYEEALKCFDAADKLIPGDYYTTLYAAWSLLESGEVEKARRRLEALLSLADTSEAHQLLGRLELRSMNYIAAERSFRRSLEIGPALPESLFGLATALRHRGETEASREAFARFTEKHREQRDATRELYRLNQKYLATRDADPAVAEELARRYLHRADFASAEQFAWLALRRDPRRAGARLCLARSVSRVGRYREAFVHYRRIVRSGDPLRAEAERELKLLIKQHARKPR